MKLLLLMTLIFPFTTSAESKLCEYLKVNTFQKYGDRAIHYQTHKNVRELVAKVSVLVEKELAKDCKEGTADAGKDPFLCTYQCVQIGSSQYRNFANSVSMGMVSLNEKTQRCEDLCKGYHLFALSYEEGLKAKESPKKSGTK